METAEGTGMKSIAINSVDVGLDAVFQHFICYLTMHADPASHATTLLLPKYQLLDATSVGPFRLAAVSVSFINCRGPQRERETLKDVVAPSSAAAALGDTSGPLARDISLELLCSSRSGSCCC